MTDGTDSAEAWTSYYAHFGTGTVSQNVRRALKIPFQSKPCLIRLYYLLALVCHCPSACFHQAILNPLQFSSA